jgi:prepilin-type N-terminal cleavage/methylation domain-containing protein
MKKHNNKGFSLIELIIAIAILVILTGMLAPQFMRYIEKSREAKDMQTLDTVYEAVQAAMTEEAVYDEVIDAATTNGATSVTYLVNDIDDSTALGAELKASLGTLSDVALVSKAASGGKVCVKIAFTAATSSTSAGIDITAYCGDSTATGYTQTGTLDTVGAEL